jgi:hypothetical protein
MDHVGPAARHGPQFEDDQNVFTLRRATVFDVFKPHDCRQRLAFVAIENLFDALRRGTRRRDDGLARAAQAGTTLHCRSNPAGLPAQAKLGFALQLAHATQIRYASAR